MYIHRMNMDGIAALRLKEVVTMWQIGYGWHTGKSLIIYYLFFTGPRPLHPHQFYLSDSAPTASVSASLRFYHLRFSLPAGASTSHRFHICHSASRLFCLVWSLPLLPPICFSLIIAMHNSIVRTPPLSPISFCWRFLIDEGVSIESLGRLWIGQCRQRRTSIL